MKQITNINETARQALGISRDEYALCAYCMFRQGYPTQPILGWCSDNKQLIADFVGITRVGLYKMINRMEQDGLLQIGSVGGELRATAKFMDADAGVNKVYKGDVNKVYTERKQSLHAVLTKFTPDVNKVNEVKKEDKEDKEDKKEEGRHAPAHFALNEKNVECKPQGAAAPGLRDFIVADTITEMLEKIGAFYSTPQGLSEKDKIYSSTIAGQLNEAQRGEITQRFAAYAIEKGYGAGGKQFKDLNSRFFIWWKDQSRFQSNTNSTGSTGNATTAVNPYARHQKIIS